MMQFPRSSLLYDIGNYAYIEAHRLEIEGDTPVRAHLLSDITAEGNVDRVSRVLALVVAETQCLLHGAEAHRAEAHDAESLSGGDEIWAPEVYEISLPAGCRLSHATVRLLYRLIHEYMVCRVIYDWLSIAHPAYGAPWLEKATEAQTQIIALLGRQGHVRRRASSPW